MRIALFHEEPCLSVTLVSAENLVSADPMTSLNPVVMIHLLPNRGYRSIDNFSKKIERNFNKFVS